MYKKILANMTDQFRVGILVAIMLVAGVVSIVRADTGVLETIKDAVIATAAKVFELDSRVTNLENAEVSSEADSDLGGVSSADLISVTWVQTGAVASTTSGIWSATAVLQSKQSDGTNTDFWRNNTKGNVSVAVRYAQFDGLATSTQSFYVATSSTPTLNNYTFAPSTVSAKGMRNTLIQQLVATSTGDAIYTTSTSTVKYAMLRPGESIVLHIMATANNDKQCGSTSGVAGKCAAATSTARGYDLLAVVDLFATSTPVANTRR